MLGEAYKNDHEKACKAEGALKNLARLSIQQLSATFSNYPA